MLSSLTCKMSSSIYTRIEGLPINYEKVRVSAAVRWLCIAAILVHYDGLLWLDPYEQNKRAKGKI